MYTECTVVDDVQIELLVFWLHVCLLGLYSSWFIPDFNMQQYQSM